ncbi:MAG TPA: hypothetical protein VFM88_03970 [Vicinamibacteria bacterium]|nr:hypothetical protein [Vicinamibacteria bacterium]
MYGFESATLPDGSTAHLEFTAEAPDPFGTFATVKCIELSSGRIRWSPPCSDYGWPVQLSAARVLGDDFVLGTTKGVVAFSARDGSVVLKFAKSQGALVGGTWRQPVRSPMRRAGPIRRLGGLRRADRRTSRAEERKRQA